MTTPKQSPLPWKAGPCKRPGWREYVGPDVRTHRVMDRDTRCCNWPQIVAADGTEVVVSHRLMSERISDPDADLIVRAANSHKALVGALNDLLKYDRVQFGFSKLAPPDGQNLRVYFARARAAIDKAEGRTA